MDNFDLKKFLKENKALENLNPTIKSLNEEESREERADVDKYEYEKGKKAGKREEMKAKIKEMIVAELDGAAVEAEDYSPVYEGDKTPEEKAEEDEALLDGGFGSFEEGYPEEIEYEEDTYDYSNDFYDGDSNDFGDTDEFDGYGGYDIDEAKKKDEEVEDVEDVEVTDTEEEMPAEEAPAATGGLEDISADMGGTEGDLMDHLMSAFKIAKGMGNEKLETQVGNTLKFFVSEYIGGGED
jgi:hypothetical protein